MFKFLYFLLFVLLLSCVHPQIRPLSKAEIETANAFLHGDDGFCSSRGFVRLRVSEKDRSMGFQANLALKGPSHLYVEVLQSLQPIFILAIRGEEMEILDPQKGILYEGRTSEDLKRLSPMDLPLQTFLESLCGSWREEGVEFSSGKKVGQTVTFSSSGLWEKVEMEHSSETAGFSKLVFSAKDRELRFQEIQGGNENLADEVRFKKGNSVLEVFWKDRNADASFSKDHFLIPEGHWRRAPLTELDGLPGV